MLGMSFRSFRYYAKKYGLRGGDDEAADDDASAFRHFLTVGVDRNCQLPWFVSAHGAAERRLPASNLLP